MTRLAVTFLCRKEMGEMESDFGKANGKECGWKVGIGRAIILEYLRQSLSAGVYQSEVGGLVGMYIS